MVSLKKTPTKIDIKCPKNIFLGCAVSKSWSIKTIQTVAPNENINHIPEEVLKVKNARTLITIDADNPDKTSSKFFDIFIYIFSIIKLYTVKALKKIWFLYSLIEYTEQ